MVGRSVCGHTSNTMTKRLRRLRVKRAEDWCFVRFAFVSFVWPETLRAHDSHRVGLQVQKSLIETSSSFMKC